MQKQLSCAELFRTLPEAEQIRRITELSDEEAEALLHDWSWHGRPDQRLPSGDWITWLILAGRGWGKTRTGAEAVRKWVKTNRYVNLIGATTDDARDIMIEGESGILAICPKDERPTYLSQKRRLEWPNGARSLIFTADEPERLRGKQHMKLWCLTADTLVTMCDGSEKALAAVGVGDRVQTRQGNRHIVGQALTRRDSEIYRLQTVGGRVITGTADHPVWVEGSGFVPLGSLLPGMQLCVTNASSGAVRLGTATTVDITPPLCGFIEKSGKPRGGQFLTVTTSIILMATKAITAFQTSNCSRTERIARCTSRRSWRRTGNVLTKVLSKPACVIANSGFYVRLLVRSAIGHTVAEPKTQVGSAQVDALIAPGPSPSWGSKELANTAQHLIRRASVFKGTARRNATHWPLKFVHQFWWNVMSLAPAVNSNSLHAVPTRSSAAGLAPSLTTDSVASVERLATRADVFDIAVERDREFFANGILVHNCDELCAWRYPEAWDQASFGLRLGTNPQAIITTTPKPTKQLKELIAEKTTIVTRGSTDANRQNLARAFISKIISKYEGTRLGRQELNAEILDDNASALWKRSVIEELRVSVAPAMKRIVVAIDPAATSNANSDETGITVQGLGSDSKGYVLADLSMRGTPQEWARAAVNAFHEWKADRIIGETNNGGEMVETVIRMIDKNVPFKAVHASRGKMTRAEPISALYEQKRCHHVGAFSVLEDQMCDYDPKTAKYSPDRMDALVWGFTELMTEPAPGAGWEEIFNEAAAQAAAAQAKQS